MIIDMETNTFKREYDFIFVPESLELFHAQVRLGEEGYDML